MFRMMGREIKAPNTLPPYNTGRAIFLAGSIEMGAAEKWQVGAAKQFVATDWFVLNPRRDDWNSSWVQSVNNQQFREQVEWELDAMDRAEVILLYFDPATKSPISLLELGLYAESGKLRVVCPNGFWRKGNVEIVCKRYDIALWDKLDDAVNAIHEEWEG